MSKRVYLLVLALTIFSVSCNKSEQTEKKKMLASVQPVRETNQLLKDSSRVCDELIYLEEMEEWMVTTSPEDLKKLGITLKEVENSYQRRTVATFEEVKKVVLNKDDTSWDACVGNKRELLRWITEKLVYAEVVPRPNMEYALRVELLKLYREEVRNAGSIAQETLGPGYSYWGFSPYEIGLPVKN